MKVTMKKGKRLTTVLTIFIALVLCLSAVNDALAAAPTVTSSPANPVTSTSATLHGNVTNNGGLTITRHGFIVTGGKYNAAFFELGSRNNPGTGAFQHTITVEPGTTYKFWAFAANNNPPPGDSMGDSGNPREFTTPGGNKVATPTASPAPGTYTSAQSVTLSCSTSSATIRYTTNGSEPTSNSTVYSSPINVSVTTTIKAKAFRSGWTDSDTGTFVYTINVGKPQLGNPVISYPEKEKYINPKTPLTISWSKVTNVPGVTPKYYIAIRNVTKDPNGINPVW
jgi:hypothetical protein